MTAAHGAVPVPLDADGAAPAASIADNAAALYSKMDAQLLEGDAATLYSKIDAQLLAGDNGRGLGLALFSSLLIGSSFIIKKRGLQQAGASGVRAGEGGYSYLCEPLWWSGMVTMILGELANFAAYAYAPAILVTPLGAMSIIVSTILADIVLKEKMHICGMLGCGLCVGGSVLVIFFAPEERAVHSVEEVWRMAVEPAFATYATVVVVAVSLLIVYVSPVYGDTQVVVYILICSLTGSIGVMACKALGISIKLSLLGSNQFTKWETYVFAGTLAACVVTQMNYLNKALDIYNTAIVSSIYYVFFTVLTIAASVIMYKDWQHQTANQISAELVGFVLIVIGVYLIHATKDASPGCDDGLSRLLGSIWGTPPTPGRLKRGTGSEYTRVHMEDTADHERVGLQEASPEHTMPEAPVQVGGGHTGVNVMGTAAPVVGRGSATDRTVRGSAFGALGALRGERERGDDRQYNEKRS